MVAMLTAFYFTQLGRALTGYNPASCIKDQKGIKLKKPCLVEQGFVWCGKEVF
jgi:hypothetical protein